MHPARFATAAILLCTALVTTHATWAQERLPESAAEMQLSFAPLVKATAPAVVNIYARRVVAERRDDVDPPLIVFATKSLPPLVFATMVLFITRVELPALPSR